MYYVFITAAENSGRHHEHVCVYTTNTSVLPIVSQSRPQHSGDSWQSVVTLV